MPAEIRDKIRLHIVDTVGCGIAGAGTDLARRIFDWLAIEHAPGSCAVLGTGRGFGPAAAAFANAAAMNALDFDDGFEIAGKGMGHPGATIVSAALSAAFERPIAGREFVTAVAAAYEINDRLIASMQPSPERHRQVYGVGQHQSIGAAVAYGKLHGLDPDALENALGFAATLTPLPSLHHYNWQSRPLISFKDFVAPAAEAGVRAVQLDRAGLVGSKSVLDGERGLWRMLGSDRFEPETLTGGLGETWLAACNSLKPYPCCRWMHAALDSFAAVLASEPTAADDIDSITVEGSAGLARDFMNAAPATMVDAQFSLPFALAALAGRTLPGPAWYDAAAFSDSRRQRIAAQVAAVVDPRADAAMSGPGRRPCGRVVMRAQGRVLQGPFVELPRGGREAPLTAREIRAKFVDNTRPALGHEAAMALLSRLKALEETADVAGLVGTLKGIREDGI